MIPLPLTLALLLAMTDLAPVDGAAYGAGSPKVPGGGALFSS